MPVELYIINQIQTWLAEDERVKARTDELQICAIVQNRLSLIQTWLAEDEPVRIRTDELQICP